MNEVTNRKILGQMSQEEYDKVEGLSQSELALLDWSPRHFQKRKQFKMKETKDMKLGTHFHMALLEPKRFKEFYLPEPKVHPDGSAISKHKPAHREFLKEFGTENMDRLILNDEDMESITGMLNALSEIPTVFEVLRGGAPECVATWEYRGLKMKGKADYFAKDTPHGRIVVDAKKTKSARPKDFTRSVFNYNYDLQSAHYSLGFGAEKFLFLAVESRRPFGVGIYDAEMWREHGMRKLDRLVELYLKCQKENHWPSYTNGIEALMPPSWLPGQQEDEGLYAGE